MTLPSGLSESVSNSEELVRFLFSRGHFNTQQAKPAGFMPRNGETSVFRECSDHELLRQARDSACARDRVAKKVAFVPAGTVFSAGLSVIPGEPPLRHANCCNWPVNLSDPDRERSGQMRVAAMIAAASRIGDVP